MQFPVAISIRGNEILDVTHHRQIHPRNGTLQTLPHNLLQNCGTPAVHHLDSDRTSANFTRDSICFFAIRPLFKSSTMQQKNRMRHLSAKTLSMPGYQALQILWAFLVMLGRSGYLTTQLEEFVSQKPQIQWVHPIDVFTSTTEQNFRHMKHSHHWIYIIECVGFGHDNISQCMEYPIITEYRKCWLNAHTFEICESFAHSGIVSD